MEEAINDYELLGLVQSIYHAANNGIFIPSLVKMHIPTTHLTLHPLVNMAMIDCCINTGYNKDAIEFVEKGCQSEYSISTSKYFENLYVEAVAQCLGKSFCYCSPILNISANKLSAIAYTLLSKSIILSGKLDSPDSFRTRSILINKAQELRYNINNSFLHGFSDLDCLCMRVADKALAQQAYKKAGDMQEENQLLQDGKYLISLSPLMAMEAIERGLLLHKKLSNRLLQEYQNGTLYMESIDLYNVFPYASM